MKKNGIGLVVLGLFVIFGMSFAIAETCGLDVGLINQEPYPAVPGEYVKVVFQITGVDNPECGKIDFELV